MKNNFLEQFYTVDPDTGDYIIDIALKNYSDIFNTWDSAVYNIRDLDTSLKSFLRECAYDIDWHHNVVLRFNMLNQKKDESVEKTIEQGIRNHYNYSLFTTKRKLAERRKKTMLYIVASMMFTVLALYFQNTKEIQIVNGIILQGLTVGGWVFLWEAFSLLFIQNGEIRREKKKFKRLLNAPIRFRYE